MPRSILFPLAAAGALAACSAGAQPEPDRLAYAPSYGPPPYVAPQAPADIYVAPIIPPKDAILEPVAEAPPLQVARGDYAICRIVTERTRNGVAFTAIGDFDRSVSGDYSFTITKRGRAGSSDVVQDGPFKARAGDRRTLGTAEISVERGGGYRAVLKVYSNGRQICRRDISS